MALRTVRFDMNELARIAASAIGADRCVHVEKCPEDDFNKTYILRMDDGREVIGKVPNPNTSLRHYTTASEVATMDYVRGSQLSHLPFASGLLTLDYFTDAQCTVDSHPQGSSLEFPRREQPCWRRVHHHGEG
jgi:hypothetical protein